MKFKRTISILIVLIILFSLIASLTGIFSNQISNGKDFYSLHGETISIHGEGLYKYDSVAVASQAISQDIVTLILGIPLLIISLIFARRNSLRGKLLLTGTIGYFLYTYTSYTFLSMYNSLFLMYVLLMSVSFFVFTLLMMSFDLEELKKSFNKKMPVKFIGGFLLFCAIAVGLMWIGRIIPSLINKAVPPGLEHYSTLVIQAMDLGFVMPATILSSILLIKRKPFGYLLASIIIIKFITMMTALTAMVIGQLIAGVNLSIFEIILFPIFNLIIIFCLIVIMKNVKNVITT